MHINYLCCMSATGSRIICYVLCQVMWKGARSYASIAHTLRGAAVKVLYAKQEKQSRCSRTGKQRTSLQKRFDIDSRSLGRIRKITQNKWLRWSMHQDFLPGFYWVRCRNLGPLDRWIFRTFVFLYDFFQRNSGLLCRTSLCQLMSVELECHQT